MDLLLLWEIPFSLSPDLEGQGLDTDILNKLIIVTVCPSLPSAFT